MIEAIQQMEKSCSDSRGWAHGGAILTVKKALWTGICADELIIS